MENIQVDTSVGDYTNRWTNSAIISLAQPNLLCATKLLGTTMSNSLPLNCKLCQIPDLIHLSVFPHNIILADILFCKCYNFSKLSPVCLSIHSIRFYDFPHLSVTVIGGRISWHTKIYMFSPLIALSI